MTKPKVYKWNPATAGKHPETGAAEWTAVDHRGYRFTAATQEEAEQMRKDYNS